METLKSQFELHDNVLAEYIWIDGYNELRSKIKVLPRQPGINYSVENMPVWNFDGSSTKQGTTENSEVILRPVRLFTNPFHKGGYIVLCETYTQTDSGQLRPHQSNARYRAREIFQYADYYQPWYGLEQEYFILDGEAKPYQNDDPRKPQGMYYCGTKLGHMKGRELAEAHMYACLQAGIKISGINAEVGPSQWEYQIGPVEGIDAADQLVTARYIMQRIAEQVGVDISLHPKPIGENWAGSGCHTNFSTVQMRLPGGYAEILRSIENLKQTHSDYIKACGDDSSKRLTGDHETAMIHNFSWGVGSRNTSVRIPKETHIKQCGYYEDRRPSSNMDPYKICSLLLSSVILKSDERSAV
jgi:glutamine synthetase